MKYIINITIVIITLIISTSNTYAQPGRGEGGGLRKGINKERMSKMKSMKWAYITSEMNLTDQEMTKLKPVFDKYEQIRMDRMIANRGRRANIDRDNLTDAQAEELLNERATIQREQGAIREQYFNEVKTVLSAKQTLQFIALDREWSEKVVREFKRRKERR